MTNSIHMMLLPLKARDCMHFNATSFSKKFHLQNKGEKAQKWNRKCDSCDVVEKEGDTLVTGATQKEGGQKRSIKCIKKEMKRTKCFHISLPPPLSLSSLSPIHLFIQPCFSIHSASRQKKKRTHKTPIHKIKPIPSLS
jgi:hypothetical protein